ncbi:MAG: hypothetical protein MJZ36_01495 [Bacteroidaceae bacterium]|nr:hypothetical protein [Bacteroidaceae bacterium]
MKKLSFVVVALAAMVLASCGGNKTNQNAEEQTDSVKTFEQEQIEANIKVQIDSIASELGKLKALPIFADTEDGTIALSEEEKLVKPEYLLDPAKANDAVTLSEKYRALAILNVDKFVAKSYDMPTEAYDEAIAKLAADINDPAFKAAQEEGPIAKNVQAFYDAEEESGRLNYFWQVATSAIVEQLYIMTQNTDKFIAAFDDEAASNVTFRVICLQDAINRLTAYDEELVEVAEAIKPLGVLNALTVDELKAQLNELKAQIAESRAALVK